MSFTSTSFGGCRGIEGTHVTDYVIGAGQKIPDWPIKITFLGKAEAAIRLGNKTRFELKPMIMGFNTSNAILGLWFSL